MATMNMNEWDIVSVVTISFVNAAIQAQRSSPSNMQVSNGTLAVHAGFGTWQVTTGGSGNILMFNIPLTNMTGSVTKNGQPIIQFHYPSLSVRVQLILRFIDGGSTRQQLVVDSKSLPTTVVSLVDGNGQPLSNVLDETFIKEALTTWFGNNLSQFDHVFASIDLDPSTTPDTQWAFCKPSVVAYTYISGDSLASSYLGLMYNTAGKTTPGSAAQIDPSFIPAGCQAAFKISPTLFLANFLAPAACKQFSIPSQSMIVDTRKLTATLAAGAQVVMAPVPTSNSTYQPYMIDLQLAVENSVITTYAKTSAKVLDEWYGTVTAYNESQSWMTLGLDGSGQSLIWTNTQPSNNNHHTEQSRSFTIIQDVLEAIGIFVIAVATVLTDGAALLVIGALLGVAQGGIQWALSDMESHNVNDAPEVKNLVSNITLPAQWTSAGPFAVSQAGLYQGGFFLAGTLRLKS